jgi:N-acetylglucosamine kinase-like BadF-type ATPase
VEYRRLEREKYDPLWTPMALRTAPVYVGADVGGTWIRVATARGGRFTTETIRTDRDLRRLASRLEPVWRRHGWSRRRVQVMVVASRGLWTARERRALAKSLRGLARRVAVISDAQAALLGALGNRPGVLVLSGTGSILVGYDGRGRWARAGGLGPLIGDEGSGFWLGREWLRATVQARNLSRTLRLVHAPDPVAAIAALAPSVLARAQRGDPIARRIVRDGQRHLAANLQAVARRLALRGPIDASWAGRVLGNRWFRAGVMRAMTRAGLRARWHQPAEAPVVAAARLAEILGRRGQ